MIILDDVFVIEQIESVHISYIELEVDSQINYWEQWNRTQTPTDIYCRLLVRGIKGR